MLVIDAKHLLLADGDWRADEHDHLVYQARAKASSLDKGGLWALWAHSNPNL